MFKVAICDDEMTSLMINQALTEQVLEEANIEYEITTFEDMQSMIKGVLDDNADFDLLLSDILAVGMNGIEAAEEIRRLGALLQEIRLLWCLMSRDGQLCRYPAACLP